MKDTNRAKPVEQANERNPKAPDLGGGDETNKNQDIEVLSVSAALARSRFLKPYMNETAVASKYDTYSLLLTKGMTVDGQTERRQVTIYEAQVQPESRLERIARLRKEISELEAEKASPEEEDVVAELWELFHKAMSTRPRSSAQPPLSQGAGVPEQIEAHVSYRSDPEALARLEERVSGLESMYAGDPTGAVEQIDQLRATVDLLTSSPADLEALRSSLEPIVAQMKEISSRKGRKPGPAGEAENGVGAHYVKVRELHARIPEIQQLSHRVGPLASRMRLLHGLHADAIGALDSIRALEMGADQMQRDIDRWKHLLQLADGAQTEAIQTGTL